ncbi:MAG: hypothetical protein FD123_3017 [Bacteroidetes bacterium]|nr:MAG: hypothetical protein FD123_3017 [Bacteroidota bacterium]
MQDSKRISNSECRSEILVKSHLAELVHFSPPFSVNQHFFVAGLCAARGANNNIRPGCGEKQFAARFSGFAVDFHDTHGDLFGEGTVGLLPVFQEKVFRVVIENQVEVIADSRISIRRIVAAVIRSVLPLRNFGFPGQRTVCVET